jgi:hypothetical protein
MKRPTDVPSIGSCFVSTRSPSTWSFTMLRVVSDVYPKHSWRVTDKGKEDEVSWKINVEALMLSHHRTEGVRFVVMPQDMMYVNLMKSHSYKPATEKSFKDMLKVVFV